MGACWLPSLALCEAARHIEGFPLLQNMETRTGQLVRQGLARHYGISFGLLAFIESPGLGAVALCEVRCLHKCPGQILNRPGSGAVHKILKSGCKAEDSKLRTADRLANLISIFCILSWRIFWLTMISRCAPQAPAEAVFTSTEIELLERIVPDLPLTAHAPPLLRNLIKVARLGGYLGRASDAPPGNTVVWRGMRRLTDIQLGYELALNRSG